MPENKHLRFIIILFYCFIGFFAVFITFRYIFPIVAPFLAALILAMLIERPVSASEKHLHLPRALASGLCTVLVFGIFSVAVWFVCTKIFTEVRALLALLPSLETIRTTADALTQTLPLPIRDMASRIRLPSEQLVVGAGRVALSLPSLLFALFTTLLSTFFLSAEKDVLLGFLGARFRKLCVSARRIGVSLAGCYLRAAVLLFLLTFALLALGLSLLRIRYALGLSFLTALLDAVPVFGAGAVLLPMAIFRAVSGEFVTAVGLTLLYLVLLSVRSIAEPKILGEQIGLPPFFTLFFLYIGIRVFGLFGFLLPPFAAIGFRIYKNRGKAAV